MISTGVDGDLVVHSGETVNLLLDHRYNFRSITVQSGGTISTNQTQGSVLYLAAQNFINISGEINLAGKMAPGKNTWSTVIDGITFNSPSCADGGQGGAWNGYPAALSYNGFGAGGQCGFTPNAVSSGGRGDYSPGAGGNGGGFADTGDTIGNTVTLIGGNGGIAAGGGGTTYATVQTTGGSSRSRAWANNGGGGGAGYGSTGGDGSNPAGSFGVTFNGGGSISYNFWSCGGGGGGGQAGSPGVHLVLYASEVNIYSSANMRVNGTAGQNGGNGGNGYGTSGYLSSRSGLGGGGGGGGKGGNIDLFYGTKFTAEGPVYINGGNGGDGGFQGGTSNYTGYGGNYGGDGEYRATRVEAAYGSMMAFM